MKPLLLFIQRLSLKSIYSLSRLINLKIPPFASASALIEHDGKILVMWLSYKRGYALPGGLLQANETFEEGLIREVKEETGLDVKVRREVSRYSSADDYPTINIVYEAIVSTGKIVSSTEGKVSWQYPKDVIYQMAHSDNRQAILEYYKLKIG
jgi:ADP-ribose pyrophosphatase YjhB (NUDIX family)